MYDLLLHFSFIHTASVERKDHLFGYLTATADEIVEAGIQVFPKL